MINRVDGYYFLAVVVSRSNNYSANKVCCDTTNKGEDAA